MNGKPTKSNSSSRSQTKPKTETWIVIPDIHTSVSREHDELSLGAVEQFMASKRFDGYLNLGDLLDFVIISSHNIGNLREVEGGRIFEEYKIADSILTRHEQIIRGNNPNARMVYLEGNHEYRIERYLNVRPELEGMLEVDKCLHLKEHRIDWVRSWSRGELFQLGNCFFHHGLYCNDHHAKKMVQRFTKNILYGHCHDLQIYTSYGVPADNVLIGASLGCLCKIPQRYLRGGPTRWMQAITIFQFEPATGHFTFNPIRINNHKLIY